MTKLLQRQPHECARGRWASIHSATLERSQLVPYKVLVRARSSDSDVDAASAAASAFDVSAAGAAESFGDAAAAADLVTLTDLQLVFAMTVERMVLKYLASVTAVLKCLSVH